MKVLVTGANGFVAQNLLVHLRERKDVEVLLFSRSDSQDALPALVAQADFIFHLAGVNRPQNLDEFAVGNAGLTQQLCEVIAASGRKTPVVYTSSIQAGLDNPYGSSKRDAEKSLRQLASSHEVPIYIFRLPNIFGKWARPNYNSAVATFCHNIARDLPIQNNDSSATISLVYVDDVVRHFVGLMDGDVSASPCEITPQYQITVGELAEQVKRFRDGRVTLVTERVGTGLVRALHSTYLSYLPTDQFSYAVPAHGDPRGVFVEMLKTPDAGQFSYFTAHPGITRGGHYHHSKTEKFLVVRGSARFRFRHMVSGAFHQLFTTGEKPEIVETIPGWTHDITNVGNDEMIVLLWANEIFERDRPDTYACELGD
jgi:UDP-2-acetamido-2,6-beta-L-arabino-hexul-4-ose reductase